MMKEMKTRKKLIVGMAMAAIACLSVGAMMAKPLSAKAETQGLTGFYSPGASVFIATEGEDTKQMRFQVNLDDTAAEQYRTAAAEKTLQSGVVVLPYDIYLMKGYTELTKDTLDVVTADVTENWTLNENGDYVSYAYLPVDSIPQGQYNRALIARGYVIDGDNVYYTEPVRASMAYVAWKNLGMAGGAYDTTLKSYTGPYTLTYGEGEDKKIENVYYGDSLSDKLPATVGGYAVEGWYWDRACNAAIESTDYATGSMPVYYKIQEYTVSGKVTCADVDLSTVKIAVDDVDTGVTVAANGEYSVSVQPGTHKFTFSCEGYKAYAFDVVVEGDCTLGDAELKADLYEVGNFGNVKTTEGLVAKDDFSGNYTVTGNNYLLMMPNTATTEDFTYTVQVSGLTAGRDTKAFAASVSNGVYALSIGLYQWETIVVNLSSQGGAGWISYYDLSGTQQYIDGATIKIVRTASKINVYVLNTLYLTFTSEGLTPAAGVTNRGWDNTFETEGQGKLAGFFGENVRLACGIAALNGEFTVTYNCNVAKHVAVSGNIAAEGVALENTTLKVDGIDTPISVDVNGAYTASVPEGTHTLTFENGICAATEVVTIVSGSNTVNVTLIDATWSAGNYGSVKSNNTPELNESGEYTISGANQLVVFPNTATSAPFTYEVAVINVTTTNDNAEVGISLTDGKYKLTATYRNKRGSGEKNAFSICITDAAGLVDHAVFVKYGDPLGEDCTLKFVVTTTSIEFYVNTSLIFTFKPDSFASTVGGAAWSTGAVISSGTAVTDAYKKRIAGFFATGAKIAVGINNGLNQGSATATYSCSITKN